METTAAGLDEAVLDRLRGFDTPTVYNALVALDIGPREEGFMRPEIRALLPRSDRLVGFAATARIRSAQPPPEVVRDGVVDREAFAELSRERALRYWDVSQSTPAPRVAVVQDLDPEPVGSLWGEVNASLHKAMGFVGAVTNGVARDLDALSDNDFLIFATTVAVPYVWLHFIDSGGPVEVGGTTVNPGDVIHADMHGVIAMPPDVAAQVPAAADQILEDERRIIDYCRSPDHTLEGLKARGGGWAE